MSRLIACLFLGLSAIVDASDKLPVIDMHLHAFPADAMAPPPLAMSTPMKSPAWDPGGPYGALFTGMAKDPPREDPVWSPMSDGEVMTQTIEVMERRNIIGVLSGTPDRVKEWRAAAPDRFLPGIGFLVGGEREYPVQVLRQLHEEGRLAVFAEIVNQYAGYPMLDDLLALMFAHPHVYVEVGVIVHTIPRPAFYRFLQGITDAGYGNRVMFGSDQMVWSGTIERGTRVIEEAPFTEDEIAKHLDM